MPHLKTIDYRILCLLAACGIYAFFGSPTPSQFGPAEILIGVLLLISAGWGSLRDGIMGNSIFLWQSAGQILLLYGLTVTFIIAALNGHGLNGIFRDIVPFLFLALPLFLWLRVQQKYFSLLLCAIIFVGMIFSVRSLFVQNEELLYLENMPTVLFAALFLSGSAFERLLHGNIRNILIATFLGILALFPIAAMAATSQRASLGAVVLYGILVGLYHFTRTPLRAVPVLFCLGIVVLFVGISFSPLVDKLMEKTQAVGLNMRPQEFVAVWNVVSADIKTFLLGIGWGGKFHSPAVGNLSVSFTHNFFTSFLLKSGLFGMVLAGMFIAGILAKLSQVARVYPALGIALLAPILVDITLYASFKSLDFGLMLLMSVSAWYTYANPNANQILSSDAQADHPIHEQSLSAGTRRDRPSFE